MKNKAQIYKTQFNLKPLGPFYYPIDIRGYNHYCGISKMNLSCYTSIIHLLAVKTIAKCIILNRNTGQCIVIRDEKDVWK